MRFVRYYQTARQRSPWSGLENEIDRLFQSSLAGFGSSRIPVDLHEDQNNVYVRAELPGVSREAITVEVVDGDLNLSAVRKTPATEGKAEETSATLSRSIQLPVDVQTDAVSAVYENGVLTVTLPKREEAKPRKVNVAVK